MTVTRVLGALALAAWVAAGPGAAAAQDRAQTLADIRQELSVLYVEIQRLKRELSTTAAPGTVIAGVTPLERLDAIEAELQRLTAKTEELEFRIDRITRDGTNRIGDLEFRLCELEEGCDIASLGDTPTLGGVDASENLPTPAPPPAPGGPSLAIGEQAEFERAAEALAQGDFQRAAELFAAHVEAYPGGPLSAEAHLRRGDALTALGRGTEAARAYLASFSGDPNGPFAPEALTKLGRALAALGQTQDACITLGEVAVRFPGDPQVAEARQSMAALGCG